MSITKFERDLTKPMPPKLKPDVIERERGDKVDFHVHLYPNELKIIDAQAAAHDCSRAEIIGGWARLFRNEDLTGKVKPGRREGGGRKKRASPIVMKTKGYL